MQLFALSSCWPITLVISFSILLGNLKNDCIGYVSSGSHFLSFMQQWLNDDLKKQPNHSFCLHSRCPLLRHIFVSTTWTRFAYFLTSSFLFVKPCFTICATKRTRSRDTAWYVFSQLLFWLQQKKNFCKTLLCFFLTIEDHDLEIRLCIFLSWFWNLLLSPDEKLFRVQLCHEYQNCRDLLRKNANAFRSCTIP